MVPNTNLSFQTAGECGNPAVRLRVVERKLWLARGIRQHRPLTMTLDEEGYPTSLAADARVESLMFTNIIGHYPAGTYTLSFVGSGTVR